MVKQHLTFDDTNPFTLNSSSKITEASSTSEKLTLEKPSPKVKDKVKYATEPPLSGQANRKRAADFFEEIDRENSDKLSENNNHVQSRVVHQTYVPQTAAKRQKLSEAKASLPIAQHDSMLRSKISDNQVIILLGETGSGKSTQLPQFLLDAEFAREGCIAITQPRRVAAINLAKRVAEERDVKLGAEVGYSIRFDDSSSKKTKIKYLTDGMLLVELLHDPLLSRYNTIILDEAHERTLITDLLLGFMKSLLKLRIGLKVVVMSATLDAERFSDFFDQAEIVKIQGRTFPVEIYYTKTSQDDYIDSVLRAVFQIHMTEATGDILVFLSGSEEIENLCSQIRDYAQQLPKEVPRILALPLYASLPQDAQARVFAGTPKNTRKIILSTNIAETSVTVPGVCYVIDSGLQKTKSFNSRIGFEALESTAISQSNANQRTGRAGREAPGKCWRMYTESTFLSLDKETEAEIKRVELSSAILSLKARGVDNVLEFDFIEKPSHEAILRALEHLYSLSALNDLGHITPLGHQISTVPLSPSLARVLMAAGESDCLSEVLDIVSGLSVEGLYIDKADKREQIAEARNKFESVQGDHITLLNLVRAYMEVEEGASRWCEDNFVDKRAMQTILLNRKQLIQHCLRAGLEPTTNPSNAENILRAFLTGYVSNTAFLSPDGSYRTTVGNTAVSIHPSSVLYGKKCEGIVYFESVFTTRLWVRQVSRIESSWVREAAPAWAGRKSA